MLDIKKIRVQFPILTCHPDLVYMDSAATSLKPQVVIDAEREYLEQYSANVGRGLYPLAEQTTEKFESVRAQVAQYIDAQHSQEIIFTSGTTASINLVAQLLAHTITQEDNIVITTIEHHSNYLPWKELARAKNAKVRITPLDNTHALNVDTITNLVDKNTKIVAFSAISNVLGTINPTKDIISAIKKINPKTIILVDAAQAIGHRAINVVEWNADFVAFSAHKCFGPTGVGVLYGKMELLNTLHPVTFGGGMVIDAHAQDTIYREIPYRFEAGTPNIAGVIAFGAALKYIDGIGIENIHSYEISLVHYALEKLKATFGDDITILGHSDASHRSNILSFSFTGVHPHDIAHMLGERNICVRAGEHCAAPLHHALHLPATTRLSFSIYNTREDIDTLITELQKIITILHTD